MSVVFVTNRGDVEHSDSYAGITYKFTPGVTVEVPHQAAQEILGYGHTRKEQFVTRLGWSKNSVDMAPALERLATIEISTEPPVQNRSLPSAVGVVPLQIERGAGRKAPARAA